METQKVLKQISNFIYLCYGCNLFLVKVFSSNGCHHCLTNFWEYIRIKHSCRIQDLHFDPATIFKNFFKNFRNTYFVFWGTPSSSYSWSIQEYYFVFVMAVSNPLITFQSMDIILPVIFFKIKENIQPVKRILWKEHIFEYLMLPK